MRTIHKVTLRVADDQWVTLPKSAVILSVGEQRDNVCLWYGCETEETEKTVRHISIFGTGNMLPEGDLGVFLGTVSLFNGAAIWHVFDRGEDETK